MRSRWMYILEIVLAIVLFWMGLFGVSFLFIDGPRSAAITLGILGVFFYLMNTMGYVMISRSHPVAVVGSVVGAIGVIMLIIQIFGWNIWIIGNPIVALIYFAIAMCTKAVIALFLPLEEVA